MTIFHLFVIMTVTTYAKVKRFQYSKSESISIF